MMLCVWIPSTLTWRASQSHYPCQSSANAAHIWHGIDTGMQQLQRLDLGWCSSITDADVKSLAALTAVTELQLARTLVNNPHLTCPGKEYMLVLGLVNTWIYNHFPQVPALALSGDVNV